MKGWADRLTSNVPVSPPCGNNHHIQQFPPKAYLAGVDLWRLEGGKLVNVGRVHL